MSKYVKFNENNFFVSVTESYKKMVETTTETRTYEVYSYKTLMAKIVVRDTYGVLTEVRYYPKSGWYSVTTAKHIRRALGEVSPRLLRMFRELGNKRVIENKISFGYAIIRGESPIERIFNK